MYVNSPHEHLSKWKDTYATAFKTDGGYEIVTIDEDGIILIMKQFLTCQNFR